jgi:signal recognition particle subunit SRP14
VIFGEASECRPEPVASDLLGDLHPSKPLPIIIRATSGKSREHKADKIKLSTIVEVDALKAFFMRYAEVCKSGMSGLKKRDRSKGKKKMKAKKKKGGTTGGPDEVKKA